MKNIKFEKLLCNNIVWFLYDAKKIVCPIKEKFFFANFGLS